MKKMSLPVVFFGNEKLATGISGAKPIIRSALSDAGFEIEQHVTGGLTELKPHKAKLAVLAAYGRIIPQSILDQFPLGIINVHPSLLPLYRGPTPIEQSLLDGAVKTGVSIIRLTAGMDEGPVYKQKTVRLTGAETKAELSERLQRVGGELLVEVLPSIFEKSLNPRRQAHSSRATYSQKLTKSDGIIDWSKPAELIEREIRAYAGWPGSRTTIAGKDVTIIKVHILDANGQIGVAQKLDGELAVFTKSSAIVIDELKPAGKNTMSGKAFLAGHKNILEA